MKYLMGVLHITRWLNLVMGGISVLLFYYCIVEPIGNIFPIAVVFVFASCVMSVAAAGNIINDYYDLEIDQINKPEKVYIGNILSVKNALALFFIFNTIGLLLSFYMDVRCKTYWILPGVSCCIVLLWVYSRYLKKMYLLGNITVALLTAAPLILLTLLCIEKHIVMPVLPIALIYIFFSFWTSLIREIIKDCEDVDGDRIGHSNSIPIASGLILTKKVVLLLLLVLLGTLFFLGFLFIYNKVYLLAMGSFVLTLLTVYIGILVKKAERPEDFHRASNWCKILMLSGLLSMVFLRLK